MATPEPPGDLWVFAYGSLMWRPEFAYVERRKALVWGWRRRLCVCSHVYRGAPERPGLVLGLDRGGACSGVAFRVEARRREATVRYLRKRELVTGVYHERFAPTALDDGRRVLALTYVADRAHAQYAGAMSREATLKLVREAAGQSGDNAEYVLATRDHLRALGVVDGELEWLAGQLRGG